jgi:hypothetical protein
MTAILSVQIGKALAAIYKKIYATTFFLQTSRPASLGNCLTVEISFPEFWFLID